MTDYRDIKSDSVAKLILETVKEDSKEKKRDNKTREKRDFRDSFFRKRDRDCVDRNSEKRRDHTEKQRSFPATSLRRTRKGGSLQKGAGTGGTP